MSLHYNIYIFYHYIPFLHFVPSLLEPSLLAHQLEHIPGTLWMHLQEWQKLQQKTDFCLSCRFRKKNKLCIFHCQDLCLVCCERDSSLKVESLRPEKTSRRCNFLIFKLLWRSLAKCCKQTKPDYKEKDQRKWCNQVPSAYNTSQYEDIMGTGAVQSQDQRPTERQPHPKTAEPRTKQTGCTTPISSIGGDKSLLLFPLALITIAVVSTAIMIACTPTRTRR